MKFIRIRKRSKKSALIQKSKKINLLQFYLNAEIIFNSVYVISINHFSLRVPNSILLWHVDSNNKKKKSKIEKVKIRLEMIR